MTQPTQTEATPHMPASKEGTGRYTQEKIMLALVLVFFIGIFALTMVPPQFTGVAMGLILFLTMVALFKFN